MHSSNKTEFMGSAKKEGQFHSSSQTTIVKICLKIEFISAIVFDIQINFLIVPERDLEDIWQHPVDHIR